MRNVHNAVSDALVEINASRRLRDQVNEDPNSPGERWIIVLMLGEKRMDVEVLRGEANDGPYACVLENAGFSGRFMNAFMDALLHSLED